MESFHSIKEFPLSLKDHCCLYIVGHLDKLPLPSILAALPPELSTEFLGKVPAADLQGIDEDGTRDTNESWEKHSDNFTDVFYSESYSIQDEQWNDFVNQLTATDATYKDRFLDLIIDSVYEQFHAPQISLDDYKPRTILDIMPLGYLIGINHWFSVKGVEDEPLKRAYVDTILKQCLLSKLQVGEHVIVYPHRLSSDETPWATEHAQRMSVLDLLVNRFHKTPRYVIYNYYCPDEIISNHKEELVRRFLAGTEALVFSCSENNCPKSRNKSLKTSDGEPFLQSLFDHGMKNLKKVVISSPTCVADLDTEFTNANLHFLAPYFTAAASGSARCTSLEEMDIGIIRLDRSKLFRNQQSILPGLISCQTNLKVVTLWGKFNATTQCEELLSSLTQLIQQPQFESLRVIGYESDCELPVEGFLQLLATFLTCTASHSQCLSVTNVSISALRKASKTLAKIASSLSTEPLTEEAQRFKKLELDSTIVFSADTVKFLGQLPPICLQSLTLPICPTSTHSFYQLPNIKATAVVLTIMEGSKHVKDSAAEKVLSEQLLAVFTWPSLTSLTLRSGTYNLALPVLGNVIATSVPTISKTFTTLELDGFTDKEEESLRPLFAAVLDLVKAMQYELRMINCDLTAPKLSLFHKVWKEKCDDQLIHKFSFNTKKDVHMSAMAKAQAMSEYMTVL